ncbi:MAG: phosphohydrolase [Candidatus Omnitrophota bacterium]|nr:MAG: phosphohydrolase [Candidatus Omnitrophota bacterium]
MTYKCPGQDKRNIEIETIPCQDCGYLLEIFSDEVQIHCPRCKSLVCRDRLPSCIDWCRAARECIDEEKLRRLKKTLPNKRD